MKASVVTKEPGFKPVTFTVTCENEGDLRDLHRLLGQADTCIQFYTAVYEYCKANNVGRYNK